MAKEVSFTVGKAARQTITRIAERAVEVGGKHGSPFDLVSVMMDVTATHANGCRLRLDDLAEADEFNFLHDIVGIERHLDRDTGQLRDCFLPRFAA